MSKRDYLKNVDLDIIADKLVDIKPILVTLPNKNNALVAIRRVAPSANYHFDHYYKVYTAFNVCKIGLDQIGICENNQFTPEQLQQIQNLLDAPSNIDPREIEVWRNCVANANMGKFEDAVGFYWADCAKDIQARRDRQIKAIKEIYKQEFDNVIEGHVENDKSVIFGDIDN